jgi:hypothetical protein
MLKITTNNFSNDLALRNKIDEYLFTKENLMYFDNDGFELSNLEKEFYRVNNVLLSNCLNHQADQKIWFECENDNFYLDHSLMLQRWELCDEAKEQVNNKSLVFPQCKKYIKLRKKWGLDFALEYFNKEEVLEVIHIENDYRNFNEAFENKKELENKILSTDWHDFVKKLNSHKYEWQGLSVIQQNDWKASYWGMPKAETTFKAFSND